MALADTLARKYRYIRLLKALGSIFRTDASSLGLVLLAYFILPLALADAATVGGGMNVMMATAFTWPDIQFPVQFASAGMEPLTIAISLAWYLAKCALWSLGAGEIAQIAAARLGLGAYRPFQATRAQGGKLALAGLLFGVFQYVVFFAKTQIPASYHKDVIVFFLIFESISVFALAYAAAFIADAKAPTFGAFRSGFGLIADELNKDLIIFIVFVGARLAMNLLFQGMTAVIPPEASLVVFQLLIAALYFPYLAMLVLLYMKLTRYPDGDQR